MASKRFSLIVLASATIGLSACAERVQERVKTVTVQTPVAVTMTPPAELMQPFQPREMPVFISPKDPKASVALSIDDAGRLQLMVFDLNSRLVAWQAWAEKK